MKTKFMLLLLSFFILFIGCDKDVKEPNNQLPEGKLIKHSDCKSFYQKSINHGNNESCVEYSFLAGEKKLILKHINTGFNCCPGDLGCIVQFDMDTIVIQEFELEALCNCECLFDMDIEITGIEASQYYVKFVEPYCGDQEKLEFIIDLLQNPTGEYCVERNQYPWGI